MFHSSNDISNIISDNESKVKGIISIKQLKNYRKIVTFQDDRIFKLNYDRAKKTTTLHNFMTLIRNLHFSNINFNCELEKIVHVVNLMTSPIGIILLNNKPKLFVHSLFKCLHLNFWINQEKFSKDNLKYWFGTDHYLKKINISPIAAYSIFNMFLLFDDHHLSKSDIWNFLKFYNLQTSIFKSNITSDSLNSTMFDIDQVNYFCVNLCFYIHTCNDLWNKVMLIKKEIHKEILSNIL